MTIDQANAYDLREPMQVRVQLLNVTGETVTASGVQGAKVYDNITDTSDAMVKLADLQGDGFLLDGSAVLNGATLPEGTKLGLRSAIGSSVSFTATGWAGSSLIISGKADSVLVNGTLVLSSLDGVATIEASSGDTITLEKQSGSTTRAELRYLVPGSALAVTNENLESCVVSLRSDLDILNPSLPSSEIEVSMYYEEDIADAIANVPEWTPIIYSAGYTDEMSDERKFYLTGEVTQEGNLISFKGQDATAKLEEEFLGVTVDEIASGTHAALYGWAGSLIGGAGINYEGETPPGDSGAVPSTLPQTVWVQPSEPRRTALAWLMAMFRHDYSGGAFDIDEFYLDYVDAGRPSLRWTKRTDFWNVDQEDCGSWKIDTHRKLGSITFTSRSIVGAGREALYADAEEPYSTTMTKWFSDYYLFFTGPWYASVYAYGAQWVRYSWTNVTGLAPEARRLQGMKLYIDDEEQVKTSGTGDAGAVDYNPIIGYSIANGGYTGGKIIATGTSGAIKELYPGGYTEAQLFARSNKGGSFTFKGDPRMQPRDYAKIALTDGTTKDVTLETLTITHRRGGTSEEVTYREGWI